MLSDVSRCRVDSVSVRLSVVAHVRLSPALRLLDSTGVSLCKPLQGQAVGVVRLRIQGPIPAR